MNALIQQENGLIGGLQDIEALEQKKKAHLLVTSDSHGDYDSFRAIIENFGPDADALIFCGDGACDIIQLVVEAREDRKLRAAIPPVIAFARGNGDSPMYRLAVDEDAAAGEEPDSDEPPVLRSLSVPDRISFCTAGRTVLVLHGHHHNVDWGTETLAMTATTNDADIICYGHTHRANREEAEGSLLLNPGSPSRPRGGLPPTFACVTFPGSVERFETEFFMLEKNIFGAVSFSPFSL